MSSDNKSPGFWFYTADFEKDMQILSLAAQGLWIRMLCWMHDNEAHRGFAELPSGSPMTDSDIARKVGKPLHNPGSIVHNTPSTARVKRFRERKKASSETPKALHETPSETLKALHETLHETFHVTPPAFHETVSVADCLAEMERVGIFSRDERGCIYSRRMARDTHISVARKAAAGRRWESAKQAESNGFSSDFAHAKPYAKDMQKASVSASVTDSSIKHPLQSPVPGDMQISPDDHNPEPESFGLTTSEPDLAVSRETKNTKPTKGKRTTTQIRVALGPERLLWWNSFWEVWVRHDGMNPAMDAFERKVTTREVAEKAYRGAKKYAAQMVERWKLEPNAPYKWAQGWINEERWDDDSPIVPAGALPQRAETAAEKRRRETELGLRKILGR